MSDALREYVLRHWDTITWDEREALLRADRNLADRIGLAVDRSLLSIRSNWPEGPFPPEILTLADRLVTFECHDRQWMRFVVVRLVLWGVPVEMSRDDDGLWTLPKSLQAPVRGLSLPLVERLEGFSYNTIPLEGRRQLDKIASWAADELTYFVHAVEPSSPVKPGGRFVHGWDPGKPIPDLIPADGYQES
jgi:hypothetical protein